MTHSPYSYEDIRSRIRLECHRRHFILQLRKKFKQISHQILKTPASNEAFNIWLLECLAMSALSLNTGENNAVDPLSLPPLTNYDYLVPIRFPSGSDRISRSLLNSFPCSRRHPNSVSEERKFALEFSAACQSALPDEKGSEIQRIIEDVLKLPEDVRYYYEAREAATPLLLEVLRSYTIEICSSMMKEATGVSNSFSSIRETIFSTPSITCFPPSILKASSNASSTALIKPSFISVQSVQEKDGDSYVKLALRKDTGILDPSDPTQHLLEYKIHQGHYAKLKHRAQLFFSPVPPPVPPSSPSFTAAAAGTLKAPALLHRESYTLSAIGENGKRKRSAEGQTEEVQAKVPGKEVPEKEVSEKEVSRTTEDEIQGNGKGRESKESEASGKEGIKCVEKGKPEEESGKNEQSQRVVDQNDVLDLDPVLDLATDALIWCVLHRYNSLAGPEGHGGGWQMAMPPPVYEYLRHTFQIQVECFASPLNCTLPKFCSAFFDTDEPFGSQGNFFSRRFDFGNYWVYDNEAGGNGRYEEEDKGEATEEGEREGRKKCTDSDASDFTTSLPSSSSTVYGSFQLNPPYDEELLDQMADKLLDFAASIKNPNQQPLQYIFVLPYWPECRGIQKLLDSDLKVAQLILQKDDHKYVNGFQHFAKSRYRMVLFECETLMIFLQNEGARRKKTWKVTEGVLDELRTRWRA
eukprot:CAMPEP_0175040814 /NCGR_PEP_ID=MMETSP0052_2-20121109/1501_1 /TAXON_ID=51329 ORGANISM="Polytomella parva, Strain SAG 63-3" /NCGR_SAMPLE_ID=MMETSP0052_2 /ASSEMBLY_ACC=CAM_ASM_000194 /LENGTH=693 /DNA_ID=CAMNT_0016303125 /DNA_START=147 /DNA_END=2229 /DNA_ORIENTATION=+